MTVAIEGRSIHTGDAKGRMVNAGSLLHAYHSLLPAAESPEHTEGYEGFYHLENMSATVSYAQARYIIRDHDARAFQAKIDRMERAAAFINADLDRDRVQVTVKQQYRNMAEIVREHPELIEVAKEAFLARGIEPNVIPIRGGTDGAQLSFRGLPCPNISTGGYCMHGVNEFIPVSSLETMVDVLETLVARLA